MDNFADVLRERRTKNMSVSYGLGSSECRKANETALDSNTPENPTKGGILHKRTADVTEAQIETYKFYLS